VLAAVPAENAPTASSISPIAAEQNSGYETGLKAAEISLEPKKISEALEQSDIQRAIRDYVENPDAPLLALLGATSNTATSHAASLVNFFNIPMLVPSASGDNLFPSNNLWAFRLSAPGAAYAKYMFGNVLTKEFLDSIGASIQEDLTQDTGLKVAILYEQNTFGESAAVATATAAMGQSTRIGVYGSFRPVNPDPVNLKNLVTQVKDRGVQLVYLVTDDPGVAKTLLQTFQSVFTNETMPILVGQAGGFAAVDFLGSPEAEGMYVLRQQINRANCPSSIKSIYDAQSFAAVYLLDKAIQELSVKPEQSSSFFSLATLTNLTNLKKNNGPTSTQKRETIRDFIKQVNIDLPCLGKVAFDNSGQNKLINLELVKVKNNQVVPSTSSEFLDLLKSHLAREILQ